MSKLTPSAYTLIPGTQVLRSKIDVFELHDEYENKTHRVELTVDNDGVFITSCEKAVREDISISHKGCGNCSCSCYTGGIRRGMMKPNMIAYNKLVKIR
jgi:hypothetical protein